jgi:hypothetical protein
MMAAVDRFMTGFGSSGELHITRFDRLGDGAMHRIIGLILTILFTSLPVMAAEGPRTLGWNDLVPKSTPFDNPINKLSMDQQFDVESLVAIRNLKRRGPLSEVSEDAEQAVEISHRLRKQGLDPTALMLAFDRLQSDIEQRKKLTVRALDGKMVRIPGYALPLEHAGTGVTEMLLVPYVGACIHVPPPPANQTLYVKLDQSYKADDLFEPVWITGRMKVRSTNKSLSFVDGSAGVDTAYTVENVIVTPYEK